MTIIREHMHYYDKIYRMPDFIQDPMLVFGFHELTPSPPRARMWNTLEFWRKRYRPVGGVWLHDDTPPSEFRSTTMQSVLNNYGAKDVRILDYFDQRAHLVHDMNEPVPVAHHAAYGSLIDIGSIEHVFDTRQCLDNMFHMVKAGGHIFMVTACGGYFNHGLHTFSPECLLQAFELNGFELRWVTYTTPLGLELDSPQYFKDVLIWIVARKKKESGAFVCPQQGRWEIIYHPTNS